jgi:hypothetical protein
MQPCASVAVDWSNAGMSTAPLNIGCCCCAATGTSWYNMIQVEKFTEAQIDQMLQGELPLDALTCMTSWHSTLAG